MMLSVCLFDIYILVNLCFGMSFALRPYRVKRFLVMSLV